ncbi:MAG: chemotaxis-specific protein-glutamate methyltransferase CheB [Candidatus Scalindua sp.]
MSIQPVKVLVVDDSDFCRSILISAISDCPELKVIGEAGNGKKAIKMVKQMKPDLVTMDLEMPTMGGLDAIKQIMSTNAVPILVVTGFKDTSNAFTALSYGALDVIGKSELGENGEEFLKKIKLLSKIKVIKHIQRKGLTQTKKKFIQKAQRKTLVSEKVIAIASSTGGPKALSILLAELPENLPCSVVVAQHMTDGFIPGLVEHLNSVSGLTVKEGVDLEILIPGTVYLSPTGKHMIINRQKRIGFLEKNENDLYSPSCNILLSSIADVYGADAIGIILTGMGDDGASGIKEIKDSGGVTIAQDEASSVIFGMPKVAIESGCIDNVWSISEISGEIERFLY